LITLPSFGSEAEHQIAIDTSTGLGKWPSYWQVTFLAKKKGHSFFSQLNVNKTSNKQQKWKIFHYWQYMCVTCHWNSFPKHLALCHYFYWLFCSPYKDGCLFWHKSGTLLQEFKIVFFFALKVLVWELVTSLVGQNIKALSRHCSTLYMSDYGWDFVVSWEKKWLVLSDYDVLSFVALLNKFKKI